MGALVEAIQAGQSERIRELLRERPEVAEERDENGVSALMLAYYHGSDAGDAIRAARRSPLDVFEAAALGDVDRLEALLAEEESLVHAWTADGFTALHYAAFFDGPEAARVLLDHGADANIVARHAQIKVRPIHSAAASRHTETVRLLLEHGADANARQEGGGTALHAAAQHGDRELAELLLAHGADPALATNEGKRSADVAAGQGHEELATLLRGGA